MSPNWSVVASPLVLDSSSDEGETGCLFPAGVPLPDSIERNRDLHLAVSIRSHRARMVSQWVKFVLEGNSQAAAELFAGTSEFPVVVTRDLADARAWLRAHSGGGAHHRSEEHTAELPST